MNGTDQLQQINRTLKRIMWIILFPAVAGTFYLLCEGAFTFSTFIPNDHSDTTVPIVVAAADIPAGTPLQMSHFTTKLLWLDDPDEEHCVRTSQATILLGHKTLIPLRAGDPIQWSQTDIKVTNDGPQSAPRELTESVSPPVPHHHGVRVRTGRFQSDSGLCPIVKRDP